jgi:hypothetical protein
MTWTLKTIKDRCREDGDCWVWTQACTARAGHPQASIDGKGGQLVRRHAVRLSGRPLRSGWRVVDTCGNVRCCNPEHLKQTTPGVVLKRTYDNGSRSTHGEYIARRDQAIQQGMAKLNMGIVRVIRQRLTAGETVAGLAREYGIGEPAMRDIKHGRAWKDAAPATVFGWRGTVHLQHGMTPEEAFEQAKRNGALTYEGAPCAAAKHTLRYVSTRACVECLAAKAKAFYSEKEAA